MDKKDWAEMTSTGCFYLDLDWLGIDKKGHVGIFSALMNAPVPAEVKSSYELFMELSDIITSLPKKCSANLVRSENGHDSDWVSYSQKGLFAFDFSDVYRSSHNNLYYLISSPYLPLNINSFNLRQELLDVIPQFNCDFTEENLNCELIIEQK